MHLVCMNIVKPSLYEVSVSVPVSTSSGAERHVRMSKDYYIDRLTVSDWVSKFHLEAVQKFSWISPIIL